MKWDDIAKRFPGRSSIACRLRYQNYLEKRAIWDEEKKNKLARLYARFKDQMWQKVASEMQIPWRSAESMHWQLGEQEMSARANAPVFQLHPSATGGGSPTGGAPAALHLTPVSSPHPLQISGLGQPLENPGLSRPQHHRSESNQSQTRRRNGSFSRRRSDGARVRTSLPPQLGQALPQLQPVCESDFVSGIRTAPVMEATQTAQTGQKRDRESVGFVEPYLRKRREKEEGIESARPGSQGTKSPESTSHRSVASSDKGAGNEQRENEEEERRE